MGHLTDLSTKGNGPDMGVFGDRLRREREMRGITLDEITESTKISRRHLEALEREHFEQLPGGVFNKGFVRAYARFLGIDEDQAVADYSSASNEQPQPEDKFPLEIHEQPNRELNPRRSPLPLVFGTAALAGVLMGYFFWVKSKPHGAETAQPPDRQTSVVHDEAPAKGTSRSGAAAPAQIVPTQVASAATDKPVHENTAASAATAKKQAEKTFVVQVRAKEDAWVSIVADGKSVMQRVLIAERTKKIKAAKQIVVRTGNAGGIDVTFNGKSLGAIGNENEPRTLTFNATGLVQ